MEKTITGTVGEVVGRTVNTRNGSTPIFDVNIGEQKVSTFKAHIAEEAKLFQGSTVEATVDVSERNGYTNYTLLAVKLVDALGGSTGSSTIAVAPAKKGWSDEDTARVTRLSCLSTAFQYAGQAGEGVEGALSLAERLYGVAMGRQTPEPVAAVTAAPAESNDGVPW